MQSAQPRVPAAPRHAGEHLRQWRQHRRLSQEGLAQAAGISTRHLSFMETGRSLPSREMVLRLSERLQIPSRERNAFLIAAGYAPMYRELALADPELSPARHAVEAILRGHEPHPALAVDRYWNLLGANRMVPHLMQGIEAALLQEPLNVLRLSLHPNGLAPRILNLPQWREHLFERVGQQRDACGDPKLTALLDELKSYAPVHGASLPCVAHEPTSIAVPLLLQVPSGRVLNLISTTTVFGTAVDITLQELALETFFPADLTTGDFLRDVHQSLAPVKP
jgi:transcriptional regulator with XRE-family HTH domain